MLQAPHNSIELDRRIRNVPTRTIDPGSDQQSPGSGFPCEVNGIHAETKTEWQILKRSISLGLS